MIDTDHLRQWIGRQESRSERLDDALTDRFKATFDLAGATQDGDVAPLLIHYCLALPVTATAGLGQDGHPVRGGFLPPVPLPRRMWAGGSIVFHGDLRVGDRVTRRSTIRDVAVKQGRSGMLCFVTVDHRIESGGRLAVEERQDIVFRGEEAQSGPEPKRAAAAASGTECRRLAASAALLFRYSALTFNSHRIHYDTPYATQIDGYPGLVIHGPMQATLLAQFAEKLMGSGLRRLDYRALSPLFAISDFTLNAEKEAEGLRLWTAQVDGPVAMEARATWSA